MFSLLFECDLISFLFEPGPILNPRDLNKTTLLSEKFELKAYDV